MIFGRKQSTFGKVPFPTGYMGGQGIGDGMIERQMQQPAMGMAPEPKKQAFFGEGGAGRAIAGTIGDVLLQRGGNAPIYAPAMQQQNRLMQQQQQAEQERMQQREDFMFEQDYRRNNPIAAQPTEFERILQASGLPKDQQTILMQDYARNRANPVQGVKTYDADGNETLQFIRPSAMGQPQQGGVQEGATATNQKTGEKLIFSNGAWKPVGGSAGNGTGPFPY